MGESLVHAGMFVAGLLLGVFFFGGLLWSVRRGLSVARPWLWFLVSWLVRMSVVLVGFYLLSDGRWQRLVICAAGFLVSRFVVMRLASTVDRRGRHQEAENAS